MKKHNEGYTLLLVMVLVLVLGTLASVILGVAERNLDAYKSGVATMQDKYQAMGEIEKIVATMEVEQTGLAPARLVYDVDANSPVSVSGTETSVDLVSSSGDVMITCTYAIVNGSIACTSYQISTNGGAN